MELHDKTPLTVSANTGDLSVFGLLRRIAANRFRQPSDSRCQCTENVRMMRDTSPLRSLIESALSLVRLLMSGHLRERRVPFR